MCVCVRGVCARAVHVHAGHVHVYVYVEYEYMSSCACMHDVCACAVYVIVASVRPYESCKNIEGPAPSIRPFGAGTSLVQNISA